MGALHRVPSKEWPGALSWLHPGVNCTALGASVCARALQDVGTLEVPNGSNRGEYLDVWTKRAGLPVPKDDKTGEGWWWCAIWAGVVLADCQLLVPTDYPACQAWLEYLGDEPTPGSIVLYGVNSVAHHIGIVVRNPEAAAGQLLRLTIEGNRAFAGSSNNGLAVDIGPMMRTDVLGYINPEKFRATL